MKLTLLGAPGAGKGTQSDILSRKLGVPTISTGNILRSAIHDGTSVGLAAKSYIDKGQLVPDNVIIDIVQERLSKPDCANGFIPGYRPGKPTSEFIQKVLNKVTLFGAVYLGIIACVPIIISACSKAAADTGISLGGTSIIIVVGVAIETVQALESQMLMRHYKGFLE